MDEKQYREEREISLIDFTFYVLSRWRVLLTVMLLAAVVLGGSGYIQARRADEIQKEQQENELAQMPEEKEIAAALNVMSYRKIYEDTIEYYKNSVLMKIDANNTLKSQVLLAIKSDAYEGSNIVCVYEALLNNVQLYKYLEDTIEGIEAELLNEIITIKFQQDGSIVMPGIEEEITKKGILEISVVHYDADICKKIAEVIKSYIEEQKAIIDKQYGSHDLLLFADALGSVTMPEILVKQNEALSTANSLQKALINMETELTPGAQKYYRSLVIEKNKSDGIEEAEDMKESIPAIGEGISISHNVLKYVILGLMLGFFLCILILFLQYFMGNTLRENDNLQKIYGIPQLGKIPRVMNNKSLFGKIDEYILSIRDRKKRRMSYEDAIGLAAASLKIAMQKDKLTELYVVSSSLIDESMVICELLQKYLSEEDLQIYNIGNVLYNVEAMERACRVKATVLIEKTGTALYSEIQQELEFLKGQEIKILGCIVL